MKQKTLLFLFALLSTLTASAYDAEIDGIYYNLDIETKQAEVTSGDTEYTGSVTIPSTTSYNGVTYSVTNIGDKAFKSCKGLTAVRIPNSVTSIGKLAFYGCSGLTSLAIGNSVTVIGSDAFYGCSGLRSINIPNSVTTIGEWAFSSCSALTSVTIPNSVTSISFNTFSDCSGLRSINIPNSVTKISFNAFSGCSGLTSINIPNSVTEIGKDAFYGCSGLTSIVVESGNTKYDSRNNCNAIIETASNKLFAGCKKTLIPNSVTSIGYRAFSGCSSLTSINIPNSVTSIGYSAFIGCSSLTSVTIPNSVTAIEDGTFIGCSGLTSLKIPQSVTSIGIAAFWGCSKLTSVTIPKSVTSIGDRVFYKCTSLKSISVESGNPKYKSRDNGNAIIETATNTIIASCDKTEEDTVSIRYRPNLQPSVIFPLGKSIVERSQVANVEMIAKFANEHKECKILIQGFAADFDVDVKSKEEWEYFQYMISKRRADNVKKLLVKKYLIDEDRIISKGRGFTDKLFNEIEFNRVVFFSAIDENGMEYVPTKVKSSVKFTAPVIKKDDEVIDIDDFIRDDDVVDNLSVVSFNGKSFKTVCHLERPEAQDAQQYLAELLFGEKNVGLNKAYNNFLKQWNRKGYTVATSVDGNINIDLRKEYKQRGRFACYHVTASLEGNVQLSGLPNNASTVKQKEQYFKLANGVDYRFIIDTKQNKMVGIEQIFVPGLVEKLKGAFGADVSLYVEDRCLQLLSKRSDGRFIFNKTTEVHFTDYFKQLVGWNEIQNIDTPAFLHGQEGLDEFLQKQSVSLASEFDPSDTVKVSMIILEDGSATQPTIESKPKGYDETRLLAACAKMPKWMPAYKDGKPVTKEAFFSIKVPKVYEITGDGKVYDVVEQMPSYPGGMGAMMQFLISHIKYPPGCEENRIQGKVICVFVVERDGSITDLKVSKSVHPLLDYEALRVISSMPRWYPGIKDGMPVRVKFTLPVTFRLQ